MTSRRFTPAAHCHMVASEASQKPARPAKLGFPSEKPQKTPTKSHKKPDESLDQDQCTASATGTLNNLEDSFSSPLLGRRKSRSPD
jgi:hypothetical protein